MKRLLVACITIGVAGLIFVAGSLAGARLEFMTQAWSQSAMDTPQISLADLSYTVRMIDEGKTPQAKQFLNDRIDGHVMILHSLMDSCADTQRVANVNRMLAHIARHRREYPRADYDAEKLPGFTNVITHAEQVLTSALAKEEAEP